MDSKASEIHTHGIEPTSSSVIELGDAVCLTRGMSGKFSDGNQGGEWNGNSYGNRNYQNRTLFSREK